MAPAFQEISTLSRNQETSISKGNQIYVNEFSI